MLRIVAGLLFLEHGTGKLLGFPAGLPFIDKMPAGLLYFTGTMELVGGVLIVLGLFTRPVAFVLSGFMAFAYFMAHFPTSFFPAINYGEPAVAVLLRFPIARRGRPGPVGGRPGTETIKGLFRNLSRPRKGASGSTAPLARERGGGALGEI